MKISWISVWSDSTDPIEVDIPNLNMEDPIVRQLGMIFSCCNRCDPEAVPIPVLIAGGPRGIPFRELLDIVEAAMGVGGSGVCMGRQVFGTDDTAVHVAALRAIIHDGASAVEAAELLG